MSMNSTESIITAAENTRESIDHAGDRDEDEDEEEIDKELEKVAATFVLQPSSIQPEATQNVNDIYPQRESLLTFQFPGWGIDICKGAAISRHVGNTADCPSSSLKSAKKCFGAADKPGIGTFVYRIPNELWMHILRFLNAKELCSLRQTCCWFYFLASHDDAWHDTHQHDHKVEEERLLQSPLPRWIKIKGSILDSQIKQRLSYFSKGYDYLRSALNSWWNVGGPDWHYSSKSLQSLINKMAAREWPVVYDAFAVVFSERVDILANYLLTEFESGAACNVDAHPLKKGGSPQCYQLCMEDRHSSTRKSLSSTEDGLLGKEMWQFVQESWVRYKRWLSLVSTHCQYLNYQVTLERARSSIWTSTPTVYDKGIICFRNQILLRYRIRNHLQCGLSWLIRQDALDIASENDTDLLNAILHLLQLTGWNFLHLYTRENAYKK
ncbi:uncharacterized protein LOC131073520 isoform X2 [Cryptomeria japonica]|uniref:uncharacterized protein LOC131073520 isoform X2 n=1 Tax=Cryptomeria japonica TaxID=3369 RepID=UPI0027DA1D24|nr:uncharacterized protein LOC131073520 isoform X2 [Cryptomeria japonica]